MVAEARSAPPRRELHHQHRDVSGGWLRPAVFGAMDGLVSNVSLIAGVGGAGAPPHTVILTGLAGLVAGAFSMATGEYLSVSSQNELVSAEVEVERRELRRSPRAEAEELATRYIERGIEPELARRFAEQLSRHPEEALQVHALQELGVSPDDLPSPWNAAVASLLSFAVGALLPLLPYLLGSTLLWTALVFSAAAAFAGGAAVAMLTGRDILRGGLRQLGLGAIAAGLTWLVGAAFGARVS